MYCDALRTTGNYQTGVSVHAVTDWGLDRRETRAGQFNVNGPLREAAGESCRDDSGLQVDTPSCRHTRHMT